MMMIKHVEIKFDIGDYVYLKTDPDQDIRMITGILITPGENKYEVTLSNYTSYHSSIELASDRKAVYHN